MVVIDTHCIYSKGGFDCREMKEILAMETATRIDESGGGCSSVVVG